MRPTVMLAVHAETLERDPVWDRVRPLLGWMRRRGLAGTWFVYPFPARVAGTDIGDRVRALAQAGQEVAQHTHFYAGDRISRGEKRNDLSDGNVDHCIRRDLADLRAMGARPRGFVAGAWHVTPGVLDTLAGAGFAYDCSARLPVRGAGAGGSELEWLRAPAVETRAAGPLVRLPTTCSLGEWFRWGRRVTVGAGRPFQIVYLHDYDLLRARGRWAVRVFLRWNRDRLATAGSVFDRLAAEDRA